MNAMRFLILALSVIGILASSNVAKADLRVAFVVGNGAYKNVRPLPSPPIDAKAMADLLKNVGFEVIEGTNLTRDKMTEKLLDFGPSPVSGCVVKAERIGHREAEAFRSPEVDDETVDCWLLKRQITGFVAA